MRVNGVLTERGQALPPSARQETGSATPKDVAPFMLRVTSRESASPLPAASGGHPDPQKGAGSQTFWPRSPHAAVAATTGPVPASAAS